MSAQNQIRFAGFARFYTYYLALLVGYAFAWVGHFSFEVMWKEILTGKIKF